MAANRPPYTAYSQSAYYATAAGGAPGAAHIPAAASVPSYAAGYDTSTSYNNYYYDSNSYNYIQYPGAQSAAVTATAVPTGVSQWSASPAAVQATTAGYSTSTTGLIYGAPAGSHHHPGQHRPAAAAPPAINSATTAAYSTPTQGDPWKPVSTDYSQGYARGRGRGHVNRGAGSQVTNQPAGFGGGYTGAPGAPSSLSSALLASAAGGGQQGPPGASYGGRGGRGGRGGGRGGPGGGRGGPGGMNRAPPKPQVLHCNNIEDFIKMGLRGQHPTGWVQEKARKNGWHVDGKESQGEKGYSYDLIIAELSAKGLAKKKKDAKTNAFRQMAVKLAIKLNILPPQGDEEKLQKKIDAAMEMDHQVVVVSKPDQEKKKPVEEKKKVPAAAAVPVPITVVNAGPVTLPAEATEIPKEIPKLTDEELSRFPGKAVTLLIEALRQQGNIQPIFTSVNEERMPKHGGGMPRTEFTCKAKYIIHGTVFSYFGRAFNKKCAKEQASAFAYLGFTNKSFKEFTGQDAKDALLKDKAAPCISYQQQQAITVVGSMEHVYSSKVNLPAGGKKEVPTASVAPTPQASYQPPAADTRQLKRPAAGAGNVNMHYGMANKFRKY